MSKRGPAAEGSVSWRLSWGWRRLEDYATINLPHRVARIFASPAMQWVSSAPSSSQAKMWIDTVAIDVGVALLSALNQGGGSTQRQALLNSLWRDDFLARSDAARWICPFDHTRGGGAGFPRGPSTGELHGVLHSHGRIPSRRGEPIVSLGRRPDACGPDDGRVSTAGRGGRQRVGHPGSRSRPGRVVAASVPLLGLGNWARGRSSNDFCGATPASGWDGAEEPAPAWACSAVAFRLAGLRPMRDRSAASTDAKVRRGGRFPRGNAPSYRTPWPIGMRSLIR